MKKVLLVICLLCVVSAAGFAQEVGVRFGNISGGNVALDAVFSTSKFSRIHGDLSFGDGVAIDLIWDFFYQPMGNEAFDWYIGTGPYSFLGSPFELGLAAEVGLEYHFAGVPIAIGADWRPVLRIIDNTDLDWGGFGFNVRLVL
jgi:hypothetical protein